MMKLRFWIVDAFTCTRFGGNPAGVVEVPADTESALMQSIAHELGFSETVFFAWTSQSQTVASIRYFTPTTELSFAGHPTLALSRVLQLIHPGVADSGQFRLGSVTRDITVKVQRDGEIVRYYVQCQEPTFGSEVVDNERVAEALGLSVDEISPESPCQIVDTGLAGLIVPVVSHSVLRGIAPNNQLVSQLNESIGVEGMCVFWSTGREDPVAFSRIFAPNVGIVEDPATGSDNASLGAYLVYHRKICFRDCIEMHIKQGTEVNRPSDLFVRVSLDQDDHIGDLWVGGEAVIVAEGWLSV